jgi:hypothetical protein
MSVRKRPPEQLLAACAEAFDRRQPLDLSGAELAEWTHAADYLVEMGQIEVAEHAIRRLNEAYPDFAWAKNLCGLFDRMPSAAEGQPAFADDFPKDFQVVRRDGAEVAVLVFCGVRHRVGMSLSLAHRWLGRLPASLIYLRDLKAMSYMAGIPSLGPDLETTIEGLRRTIAELGVKRVVCYGNSSGGYGALLYGLMLGAQAAVCMSAPYNLEPEFNLHLRQIQTAERISKTFPDAKLDLRELYLASPQPPKTLSAFGEHHWDDRLHAEHMSGLPGLTLLPVADYAGHNTGVELIRLGRFDDLFEHYVRGADA